MDEITNHIQNANLPLIVRNHIIGSLNRVLESGIIPISIIVFGSSLRRDFNEQISDIDWILVVKDSMSDDDIDYIRNLLQKSNSRQNELTGFLGSILRIVGVQTGMYVSGFVTRRCDIQNSSFAGIFNVSKYAAKILAPSLLVLGNVFSTAQTIYGEELLPSRFIQNISFIQLLKSITMNLLLSICALIIAPFTNDAIRFTAESIKWSIYAKHFYNFNKATTIDESITNLHLKSRYPGFIKRFLRTRDTFQVDPILTITAPVYVLRIHFIDPV